MRQYDGMGVWESTAKYKLCKCRFRCEINNLISPSSLLYSILLPRLHDPSGPFFPLVSIFRFPKIANHFQPSSAKTHASPRLRCMPWALICYQLCELSHCWILALGLTEYSLTPIFKNLRVYLNKIYVCPYQGSRWDAPLRLSVSAITTGLSGN